MSIAQAIGLTLTVIIIVGVGAELIRQYVENELGA